MKTRLMNLISETLMNILQTFQTKLFLEKIEINRKVFFAFSPTAIKFPMKGKPRQKLLKVSLLALKA